MSFVGQSHTLCFCLILMSSPLQEIPENIGDFAHLNFLHTPGIFSGADLRYTDNKVVTFLQHSWKVRRRSESSSSPS